MQNKMHWAAQGHTAAEIVADRADSRQPNMGLMSWSGAKPRKEDAEIAKNYLNHEEMDTLNRIVTMYLDFAELQALNRKPMYMCDWISKLINTKKRFKKALGKQKRGLIQKLLTGETRVKVDEKV